MKKILLLLGLFLSCSFLYSQDDLSNFAISCQTASAIEAGVFVAQTPPQSRAEVKLAYYDGDHDHWTNLGGTNQTGTFYCSGAISFTADQMTSYVGGTLHTIKFFIPAATVLPNFDPTYSRIFIKNSEIDGAVVYEQNFSATLGAWNTIVLTTPHTIPAGPFAFGYSYKCNNLVGQEIRPHALSLATENPHQPGGAYYKRNTTPDNYQGGAGGAAWIDYVGTTSGNLSITGLVTLSDGDCDPATNLTAVHTESGNQLTWVLPTGKGREVILDEDFEGLPDGNNPTGPAGWSTIDADGDGNNWMFFKNTGTPDIIPGHSGTGHVTSASWNNYMVYYPDNYLITPMVEGATSVSYWVCAQDADYAAEHYALCVSSTGTNASDFTIIFEETMTSKDGGDGGRIGERGEQSRAQGIWYNRIKDVPAGTKYIAWRHYNCSDWFRINLDDVTVYGGGPPADLSVNIYRDGVKIASNIEGTSYHDDYNPNLAACYKVEVNCPESQVSIMSNEACVEAVPCDPVTQASAEILDNCQKAELTWTAVAGAKEYKVSRDGALLGTVTTNTYTETGNFNHGVEYTWEIVTVCNNNESDPVTVKTTASCEGVHELGLAAFKIAPNPAVTEITISAHVNFNTVEVINFLGQAVISQTVNHNAVKLDVSNLNNGVYFVRLASENGTSVKKFVKQ